MQYGEMVRGIFRNRPNRFIAEVEIEGRVERCHVKNTGRCRELLIPGTGVWLEYHPSTHRKTAYSLITVEKRNGDGICLVNLDSQAPNAVAEEWLKEQAEILGLSSIRREQFWGTSRFDFGLEWKDGSRGYLEVKGVTLDENGIARFPDAPTDRGVRHVEELTRGAGAGLRNGILFVIQMKGIRCLEPNDRRHEAFGAALRTAAASGVRVIAMDCRVGIDSLRIDEPVPVRLSYTGVSEDMV